MRTREKKKIYLITNQDPRTLSYTLVCAILKKKNSGEFSKLYTMGYVTCTVASICKKKVTRWGFELRTPRSPKYISSALTTELLSLGSYSARV